MILFLWNDMYHGVSNPLPYSSALKYLAIISYLAMLRVANNSYFNMLMVVKGENHTADWKDDIWKIMVML